MNCKNGRHGTAFILLFLAEKPSYGLGLLKKFESELPHIKMDSAGIYRTLKALEENSLVTISWDTSATGAPKKYYHITQDGYKELDKAKIDIEFRYKNFAHFLKKYDLLMKEQ